MITTYMREDHAGLDGLFMQFQSLRADHEAAKAAFSSFKQSLQRHIAREEGILFPLFEQRTGLVDHGPSVVMRQEHWRIKGCLDAIEDALHAGHAYDGLAQELTQILAAHDRKEESVLYPWIDVIIFPVEGRELLTRMRAVAAEPRLDYCRHEI
jgi:regulator of cell morphogenesis and NO signaling